MKRSVVLSVTAAAGVFHPRRLGLVVQHRLPPGVAFQRRHRVLDAEDYREPGSAGRRPAQPGRRHLSPPT